LKAVSTASAATGREEHAIEVAGCVAGQAVGELDRRRVGIRPDREERELLGLLGGDLRETPPAVPGVDDEEAGEAVEVLAALDVVDVVSLTAGDDRHARRPHRRLACEVHPEVILRLLLQRGVVVPGRSEARRRVEVVILSPWGAPAQRVPQL
jgi:hypothetical protein